MRNKDIGFGKSTRNDLLKGVNILGNAVRVTLGPKGRNVIIQSENGGKPHITKDGVTVAKAIKVRNHLVNMGIDIIKDVSSRTNDVAGDGTTTSTVLAQAMINKGLELVDNNSVNPTELKRGMDLALGKAVEMIAELSQPITEREGLLRITNISANSDSEVGDIVGDALHQVGVNGAIMLARDNSSGKSSLCLNKGYTIDAGWINPYFAVKQINNVAVLKDPVILLSTEEISSTADIVHILEFCAANKRPLLLVAPDYSREVSAALISNHHQQVITCCAIKAPLFGDRRQELLIDIASYTGASVIDAAVGVSFKDCTPENLGKALLVSVSHDKTTIIVEETEEHAQRTNTRIATLENTLSQVEGSAYEISKLKGRITALNGMAATIKVGAYSEVEYGEKIDRIDDAIAAGRAALSEGVVAGGGVTLYHIADALSDMKGANDDQNKGIAIFLDSIRVPFEQILSNAAIDITDEISETIGKDAWWGVNASNGDIVNMYEAGIVDPARVTRTALENSVSVAGTLITTEASICLDHLEDISPFEQHISN